MLSTVPEHLKKPLDKYFRDYPKVKVVRSEERGGLTRARLLGCQASGGEVLVFLDSHIECTKGQRASTARQVTKGQRTVSHMTASTLEVTGVCDNMSDY